MQVLDTFLKTVVTQIINPIILLLAAGALVIFVWGVFNFIRNSGDEEGRSKGRDAIFWGLIGFVIIFGAYGIINVALDTFGIDKIKAIPGS